MAEVIFRQRLPAHGITISSVGIAALVGAPADPLAREVIRQLGIDLSNHRARQANAVNLEGSDLVLAAESLHSDWINVRFPHLRGRIHKLGHWLGDRDIADPFQKSRVSFEQTLQEIDASVTSWLPRLMG